MGHARDGGHSRSRQINMAEASVLALRQLPSCKFLVDSCGSTGWTNFAELRERLRAVGAHDHGSRLYVEDILPQLLAGYTDCTRLLPGNWKQSHPEK